MIIIVWLHQLYQYIRWNMLLNTTKWKFLYKWRFCRGLGARNEITVKLRGGWMDGCGRADRTWTIQKMVATFKRHLFGRILVLMCIAVGKIGLPYYDFWALTPGELGYIYKAYSNERTARYGFHFLLYFCELLLQVKHGSPDKPKSLSLQYELQ